VHEGTTLGSDGESIEVSPCTSDQSSGGGIGPGGPMFGGQSSSVEYVPKVKLRHKQNRRWTEVNTNKKELIPPVTLYFLPVPGVGN
jgi:hypothetical protein